MVVNDLGGAPDGSGSDRSPADVVVEEIRKQGGQAVANYDSVSTAQGGEGIVATAIDTFGRIDILVNNAGILRDRMIYNMTEEEWDTVIKVHLYGHFFTTKHACVHFRQQRSGRIINTSSGAGLGETFGQANYGAAKEGIIGLTRQVAKDMGRYGVTSNAIRPCATTRLSVTDDLISAWQQAGMQEAIEAYKGWKAEDIATLVVWLASDAAANVNGRTFFVATGEIALYSEPVKERTLVRDGPFTVDEIFKSMPSALTRDFVNTAKLEGKRG